MPDNSQFEMPDPDDLAKAVQEDMALARMRAELNRLQARNKASLTEFSQLAGPPGYMALQLDLLNVRIFTLARAVFGDESHALVQFQIEFEQQVAQVLVEAVTKVRQAQLGAQLSPLDVQRARQAMRNGGLLGPDGRPLH